MNRFFNRLKSYDMPLIITLTIILIIGTFSVASASYPVGSKVNKPFALLLKHLIFLAVGLIFMFFSANFPRKNLKIISPVLFLFSLALVFMLFTSMGVNSHGQTRWIKIPLIGMTFQPSDIIKVTSIIFLAKFLSTNKNRLNENLIFIEMMFIMAIAVLPIALKDLSTSMVIGFSLFYIYISMGANPKQLLIMFVIGVAFLFAMLHGEDNEYRIKRIKGFFTHETGGFSDRTYQSRQSLYAIALGGYLGLGYFKSIQKYGNLPEPASDFIFSVICEENGVIGAIILIALFVILLYRCFMIAYKSNDTFDKLMGLGFTVYLTVQSIFHMGVNVKLLPVTGITLPFISYGGSSLVMCMITMGLILRISKDNKRKRV